MLKAFLKWWKGGYMDVPYPREVYGIVYSAWSGGFTVASDTARSQAAYVAVAATLGMITTREPDGSFGRTWYVTKVGVEFMDDYLMEGK